MDLKECNEEYRGRLDGRKGRKDLIILQDLKLKERYLNVQSVINMHSSIILFRNQACKYEQNALCEIFKDLIKFIGTKGSSSL